MNTAQSSNISRICNFILPLIILLFIIILKLTIFMEVAHAEAMFTDFLDSRSFAGHLSITKLEELTIGRHYCEWGYIERTFNAIILMPYNLEFLVHDSCSWMYNPGSRCLGGLLYELKRIGIVHLDITHSHPLIVNHLEGLRYQQNQMYPPFSSSILLAIDNSLINDLGLEHMYKTIQRINTELPKLSQQFDELNLCKKDITDKFNMLSQKKLDLDAQQEQFINEFNHKLPLELFTQQDELRAQRNHLIQQKAFLKAHIEELKKDKLSYDEVQAQMSKDLRIKKAVLDNQRHMTPNDMIKYQNFQHFIEQQRNYRLSNINIVEYGSKK